MITPHFLLIVTKAFVDYWKHEHWKMVYMRPQAVAKTYQLHQLINIQMDINTYVDR